MARPLPTIPINTKYHYWTVLESQSQRGNDKSPVIKCACECGKEALVRVDHLKFGRSKSCGCFQTKRQSLVNSFWAKAIKKDSGCWEWSRARKGEYGVVVFEGTQWRVHRLAYYLAKGEFDLGLHVLHKCDNPTCFNPDHLFLGTIQDNNQDCVVKDRHTKGEMRNFKLFERDIRIIRELRSRHRIPVKELASLWGVSKSMVEKVIYHVEWKHI